jgi:uncharacterized protein (TIGR02231 family)
LAIDYIIQGASWNPIYDARLTGDSDSLELNYNAEVRQRTGEDWNQVELILSTAAPQMQAGPVELQPWQLAVWDTQNGRIGVLGADFKPRLMQETIAGVPTARPDTVTGVPINDPLGGQFAPNQALLSSVSASAFQTSFVIQRPESVPSGEKAIRTSIAQYRLAQKTELISRPRLLEGAYRQVTITNQDQAPLMPGLVALFADADFIGNATVSTLVVPEQTFDLPFGIDNSIKVERKILHYKKNQSGDKIKIDLTVSIKFWNRGKIVRSVNLEEPLPLSQDNRVKITLGDILPKAATTDAGGKASWSVTVAPGDSAIVAIPYRIEYPAGVSITGL